MPTTQAPRPQRPQRTLLSPTDHEVVDRPGPDVELGVIKDARRRQRRRRVAAATGGLALALGALIIGSDHGGRNQPQRGPRSGAGPAAAKSESPGAVFAKDPYMGVACHIPNSIACDRVGLSVWLRRPAIVTATIAGATLTLNDPTWSYVAHSRRRTLYVYAGFLQRPGLTTRLGILPDGVSMNTWYGSNAPSPLVRFRVDYGHGNIVATEERVYLSTGWG
jgi:hypothetical protein